MSYYTMLFVHKNRHLAVSSMCVVCMLILELIYVSLLSTALCVPICLFWARFGPYAIKGLAWAAWA